MRSASALLPLLLAPAALAQPRPEIARFRLADSDTSWVTQTRCTAPLPDGVRACRRLVVHDGDGEDVPQDSVHFWIERGSDTFARWTAAGTFFQSLGFDLVRLDLDADGTPDYVLAHHESEGNGLGVRFWMLHVVDGARPERTPLVFGSEEHGDDAFVRTPRGWRLLAGAWEEGTDARRGDGLYFTGRLFRYTDGRLVADAAEPVRRRRYLNTFASERGRAYQAEEARGTRGVPGQTPWRWLQHRTTQRLAADPALPPARRRLRDDAGRYLGPMERDGILGPAFLPGGETTPHQMATHVVQNGRLLPLAYVPAGGWPSGGVPARLVLYAPYDGPPRDEGGEPIYVIALD